MAENERRDWVMTQVVRLMTPNIREEKECNAVFFALNFVNLVEKKTRQILINAQLNSCLCLFSLLNVTAKMLVHF